MSQNQPQEKPITYGDVFAVMGRRPGPAGVLITIGEVLETVGVRAGDKVVDQSDAAAIQAAEMRATGRDVVLVGGTADAAQSAASVNASSSDENKIKLGDVLKNASRKLAVDKPVTKEDADGVIAAELRNNPNMTTYPGGVADSMAAAARANRQAGMNTNI